MSQREQFNPETGEIVELETLGGSQRPNSPTEMVSQGMQLLQIRTKNQLMVAVQRPRDLEKFEAKLLAIAAEAGEDFFYSIPFKDHRPGCSRRGCNCPTTRVEGPGVGLARTAASLFGNCAVETRIESESPDAFLIRSDWVDFENNYTRSETKRVSKLTPTKGGGSRVASGRMLDVVYQQGASKVERDVIVRSLPKHIIERAFEMAKAAALQEKAPVAQQIARLLRRLGEMHISPAQVEAFIGCPFEEKAIAADGKDAREICATLRGIMTAIHGGDTTAEQAFGSGEPAEAVASGAPGAISEADLEAAPSQAQEAAPQQSQGKRRNPFA